MNRVFLIGGLCIGGGMSCLALSANGPWGFHLLGRYCWVTPLVRLLLIWGVVGCFFIIWWWIAPDPQKNHKFLRYSKGDSESR